MKMEGRTWKRAGEWGQAGFTQSISKVSGTEVPSLGLALLTEAEATKTRGLRWQLFSLYKLRGHLCFPRNGPGERRRKVFCPEDPKRVLGGGDILLVL